MRAFKYGNRRALGGVILFALISSGIMVVSNFGIKNVTDSALSGDMRMMLQFTGILLGTFVVDFIIRMVAIRFEESYVAASTESLKYQYMCRLMDKNILSIQETPATTVLSQLTNDMDRYQQTFYKNIIQLVSVLGKVLSGIIVIMAVNPFLIIPASIMIAITAGVTKLTSKPIKNFEKRKSEALNTYTNVIQETLDGFYVIKQTAYQKSQEMKFKNTARKVQEENLKLDLKTSQIDAFNASFQLVITMGLMLLGVLAAKYANLSTGTALLLGFAFTNMTWPLQSIIPYLTQMNGIQTLFDSFDETLVSEDYETPDFITGIDSIKYIDVALGYDDITILDDISLEIRKGEKILILGRSGSGKSTLLKSIRRQIRPQKGNIYINNKSLERLDPYSYFSEISVIDQIGFIFNGTVEENISLNRTNLMNIENLLTRVGLGDLDSQMVLNNNGSNVSGGQRARIMLARALYLNASLIVCDEILASLDPKIASDIEKDILMQESMVLNVSHIYFEENMHLYDRVLKVVDGKVIEVK